MFQYYGADWAAITFTFFALRAMSHKRLSGFYLMATANSCWIVMGLLTGSMAMVFANSIFILMNVRTIIRWRSSAEAVNRDASTTVQLGGVPPKKKSIKRFIAAATPATAPQ